MFPNKPSTSDVISLISLGKVPPLVSHKTKVFAPASFATFNVESAYLLFSLYPSKKCSASNITSLLFSLKYFIVSSIIFRFSSKDVFNISVTWNADDFPNIDTNSVFAFIKLFIFKSSSIFISGLRVEPKATNLELFNFTSLITLKNSISFGFDPGFPASI